MNWFNSQSPEVQKRLLLFFGSGTAILYTIMGMLNQPLTTSSAPLGIISLELAWNTQSADLMLGSWHGEALKYAGLSLGVDYLFMFFYGLFLALLLWRVNSIFPSRYLALAGWGMITAAIMDGLENIFLIIYFLGRNTEFFIHGGTIFAVIKFILIFIGLFYGLSVVVIRMVGKVLNG